MRIMAKKPGAWILSHSLLGLPVNHTIKRQSLAGRVRHSSVPGYRPSLRAEPSLTPVRVSKYHSEQPAISLQKDLAASKPEKPFSRFLTDTFGRRHNYLRISVTERCNLRCLYCMPEEGVPLTAKEHLLTSAEILYLAQVFVDQGVTKIRLTGGEPTVRRDFASLVREIGKLQNRGLKELCITTNGLTLHRTVAGLVESGLTGVNLSLDTLDPLKYQVMTRRNGFSAVMKSVNHILQLKNHGSAVTLKINCVIIRGLNDGELLDFVELGRAKDVEVRFIEYMPFGGNKWTKGKMFSYQEMLDTIQVKYPSLQRQKDHPNDTSKTYRVPGFTGRIGFITSMTHNFCGTCNRLRITADGNMKVCLHGNAEISLRDMLRAHNQQRPIDEKGVLNASAQSSLLDFVESAVKRKKRAHAGLEDLHKQENRPMILIDNHSASDGMSRRSSAPGVHGAADKRYHPYLQPIMSGALQSERKGSYTMTNLRPRTILRQRCFHTDIRYHRTPKLTHVNSSGEARMVSISEKQISIRSATAVAAVRFSRPEVLDLLRSGSLAKGDVLAVARVAGIQAAKRTSELIPLCHNINLTSVEVELNPSKRIVEEDAQGNSASGVLVAATVKCEGKTGVEMEALVAAQISAATIYDMCKAVDKHMMITGVRVVRKSGGKSGDWNVG